jgi:hypothetical protein
MVDTQTISIAIASASIVAGVVYYALQIRHQSKVRQTDLVVRLYSALSGRELQEAYFTVMNLQFADYDDFMKKYAVDVPAVPMVQLLAQVCKFFDGVGVLLYRGLVDIGLVDDLFHTEVTRLWEKVKPIAEGRRKELNQPTYVQSFEYLYNELKKREQKGVRSG